MHFHGESHPAIADSKERVGRKTSPEPPAWFLGYLPVGNPFQTIYTACRSKDVSLFERASNSP